MLLMRGDSSVLEGPDLETRPRFGSIAIGPFRLPTATNHRIGIGARLPGTPPTPPSKRIRTRRFAASEQAPSIALQD